MTVVLVAVAFEVGARLMLFARYDWNPYYLTYGFVADVADHSRSQEGYSTFQPHTVKRQKRAGGVIAMQINGSGFRGDRDVTPKPAGVVRVATLGASSTFGYHVEDHQTYPVQLEARLTERLGVPVEVYNLGIPHARLDNIVALARAELPAVVPDVVTLYAGYNNSVVPTAPASAPVAFRVKDWVYGHFVAWRYVHNVFKWVYLSVLETAPPGAVETPNLAVPLRLSAAQIDAVADRVVAEVEARARDLGVVVAAQGAQLVIIGQTYVLPAVSGVEGHNAELAVLQGRLASEGVLPAILGARLVHDRVNRALEQLANERGWPWVDGVAALAGHERDAMASQVHLSPVGNQRLADAIAEVVVRAVATAEWSTVTPGAVADHVDGLPPSPVLP